ncbi:MAG TPA: DUF4339 domain-containing protein [Verrucomicrobiae bacterium]|nr:DUF4339 domain-containing protein [Verrucomicrobiae bacterium]
MNFHVRRQGIELGTFSLDELRRRREAGEFSGTEYVQAQGADDWQPLDFVLNRGYRTTPPPLPGSVRTAPGNPALIWGLIALGIIVFIAVIGFGIYQARQGYLFAINRARSGYSSRPRPDALAAAQKPVVFTTNTLTYADEDKRGGEFRRRQWLDGYKNRGVRNPQWDAEAVLFLQTWIARIYGGDAATNSLSLAVESDKLADVVHCTDPLILTVAAENSRYRTNAISRFEWALAAYPRSAHKAYPKLYATLLLEKYETNGTASLDVSGLQSLRQCFADGSFKSGDEREIAEILVSGWGNSFFRRNADAVCAIAHDAGNNFHWLALVLDGENEINKAWAARGTGYANTVSDSGWQGFHNHLAAARVALTEASDLQTNFPLAPCLMMTVALGDSGITEMREWFDRATAAQIDYPGAWSAMRWGLRPRWYGDTQSMLAFGRTALNTGRFDTAVPQQFIDCVYDVESEMDLPQGKYIFDRSDIWPDLQRVYEGYIEASQTNSLRLRQWRTGYAAIACRANKYDVAREQMEALNWKPNISVAMQWSFEPTTWPLEIAARTGPLTKEISDAEDSYQNGDHDAALKKYSKLVNATTDERTKKFIQMRLAALNHIAVPQEFELTPDETN